MCVFMFVCRRARDNLGLVLHTAWGSFFAATALYFLISNLGLVALPNLQDCGSDEFAMMAVPIAILTWACVIASYVMLALSPCVLLRLLSPYPFVRCVVWVGI